MSVDRSNRPDCASRLSSTRLATLGSGSSPLDTLESGSSPLDTLESGSSPLDPAGADRTAERSSPVRLTRGVSVCE